MKAGFVSMLGGLALVFGLGLLTLRPATAQVVPGGVTVAMRSASGAAVSGTATFQTTADGQQTEIRVALSSAAPDRDYVAHVHAGSCEAPREIVGWLMNLHTDASGAATNSTTENLALSTIANGSTYVHVHDGASAETPVLVCGNIPAASAVAAPSAAPNAGGLGLAEPWGWACLALGLVAIGGGFALRGHGGRGRAS